MDATQGFQVLRSRSIQLLDEPVEHGPFEEDFEEPEDFEIGPDELVVSFDEAFAALATTVNQISGVVNIAFAQIAAGVKAVFDTFGQDLLEPKKPHYTTRTLPKPYLGPMMHGPRSGSNFERRGTKKF